MLFTAFTLLASLLGSTMLPSSIISVSSSGWWSRGSCWLTGYKRNNLVIPLIRLMLSSWVFGGEAFVTDSESWAWIHPWGLPVGWRLAYVAEKLPNMASHQKISRVDLGITSPTEISLVRFTKHSGWQFVAELTFLHWSPIMDALQRLKVLSKLLAGIHSPSLTNIYIFSMELC